MERKLISTPEVDVGRKGLNELKRVIYLFVHLHCMMYENVCGCFIVSNSMYAICLGIRNYIFPLSMIDDPDGVLATR